LIYELDLMIKKAFRADKVRIIFLPHKNKKYGIFMEGPFNYRELFKMDLTNSLAERIIDNPGCSQITMPSNLMVRQNY
jgi:hypothetical protein